MRGYLKYS